jgi:hypothetical protein
VDDGPGSGFNLTINGFGGTLWAEDNIVALQIR